MWIIRLTSVVLTGAVILIARQPLALPEKGANGWILGIGILDTSAYVLNNYGMRLEQVSVVSVLASLYGAVTVALAATILARKDYENAVARDCGHLRGNCVDKPIRAQPQAARREGAALQGAATLHAE